MNAWNSILFCYTVIRFRFVMLDPSDVISTTFMNFVIIMKLVVFVFYARILPIKIAFTSGGRSLYSDSV